MADLRERYINFYTDIAFKRLFGTEVKDEAEIAKFSMEELHGE